MKTIFINIVFASVLISCDLNSQHKTNATKDSLRQDSIYQANNFKKRNDLASLSQNNNTQAGTTKPVYSSPEKGLLWQLSQEEKGLLIHQTGVLYSKNFIPTISFTIKNNSGKDLDVFCLRIESYSKNSVETNPISTTEKTFNKTIKDGSEIKLKVTLPEFGGNSGTVYEIHVTKVHNVDGTISSF